jgi:hypothetical protein
MLKHRLSFEDGFIIENCAVACYQAALEFAQRAVAAPILRAFTASQAKNNQSRRSRLPFQSTAAGRDTCYCFFC